MWPQRWKASASSGLTAAATAAPPVAAKTAPPRRPRNERRVMPLASRDARPSAAPSMSFSDRRKLRPSPSGGQEAVELLQRVHRSLGRHDPVDEMHGERRPRHAPAHERVGRVLFVDDVHRKALPPERSDAGGKRPAQAAVRAEKDGELGAEARQTVECGRIVADGGTFLGQLESDAGPDAQREHAHLAVEREDKACEYDDGKRENG